MGTYGIAILGRNLRPRHIADLRVQSDPRVETRSRRPRAQRRNDSYGHDFDVSAGIAAYHRDLLKLALRA